ncbi:haloacid dehalogenase type II [Nostocoides sp. HKS02]|uniref:haloacid dehalogenase type II n=1 Tax=Nostocoides sp. HKS02 TaxID=1813880 RepID=UPI0012B4C602|nr:haloacid dehalogenase type II [Tetrasphaera sp. HKS02]QGN58074.1 haloacid dehalogenase type II [Tetrasphaera sp. HKS02]
MQRDLFAQPASRPKLVVFDVNETLSDMSGLAAVFAELCARPELAAIWFSGLLRDGFALTVTGDNPDFGALARQSLRPLLDSHGVPNPDTAVDAVMDAFAGLPVHGDVVEGVRGLAAGGVRLVTLSNGAASVARGLFERHAIADCFEQLLSVADAPAWKPAASAYEYALRTCDASPAETMLVAVHPWDIHGAAAAGLTTAFVNRAGTPYPAFFSRPDLEVASLVELAEVVGEGHG